MAAGPADRRPQKRGEQGRQRLPGPEIADLRASASKAEGTPPLAGGEGNDAGAAGGQPAPEQRRRPPRQGDRTQPRQADKADAARPSGPGDALITAAPEPAAQGRHAMGDQGFRSDRGAPQQSQSPNQRLPPSAPAAVNDGGANGGACRGGSGRRLMQGSEGVAEFRQPTRRRLSPQLREQKAEGDRQRQAPEPGPIDRLPRADRRAPEPALQPLKAEHQQGGADSAHPTRQHGAQGQGQQIEAGGAALTRDFRERRRHRCLPHWSKPQTARQPPGR